MKPIIYSALLSNASALGVHWIYNHTYLKELAKKQSLLFLSQNEDLYTQAKPSYYVYPNHKIGALSFQGQILTWLYEGLKANQHFSKLDYESLIYEKVKPGGPYQGYVESYAKELVVKKLVEDFDKAYPTSLNDTHLVGFLPYLATKALNLDKDKALEFTSVFSLHPSYSQYMDMFDYLFKHLISFNLKSSIKKALHLAPIDDLIKMKKILEIDDIDTYIKSYAGRACSIEQSIPVIIYILYHQTSFEDALEINAAVGGASADRALILGAFLAQVYDIPQAWINKTKDVLRQADYEK